MRLRLPPLLLRGASHPVIAFLDLDAPQVDELLERMRELRARMLPSAN